MLADLVQAHQFTTTELSVISSTTSLFQTIMIKTTSPLTESDKDAIYNDGIESIVYAGDMSYYLYGNTSHLQGTLESIEKIESISSVKASAKASAVLNVDSGSLSSLANGAPMRFNILLMKEMRKEQLKSYFEGAGIHATIYNVSPELKSAKIRISADDFEKVKTLPLIHYIDRSHTLAMNSSKESRNLKSTTYEHVTELWNDTYKLNGQGMSVGVVDGGLVREKKATGEGK